MENKGYLKGWAYLIGVTAIVVTFALISGKESKVEHRHSREWPTLLKVASDYNLSKEDTIMLLAIRDAENGGKGFEFGVKQAKGIDLETQAKWCAGSIRANRLRYRQLVQQGVYKGSRRTIGLQDKPIVDPPSGMILWVKDVEFIEAMAYYLGPTGYGWAPIGLPELTSSELELNKNWSRSVRSLMEKYKEEVKNYY